MILFILSAGELLRRRLRLYFIDKKILFPLSLERLNIMLTLRSPLPKSKIWTAVAWDVLPKSEIWTRPQRGGCTCWTQERQVVDMGGYEIAMIVLASLTLLLKLIEVIKDLIQK